ncbi:synaptotagmin-like protein 5 [Elysia marginata]|uniref:Synaptotagmin-like protein 5 n=1 Tax=Elysia marginata TaxID=1093978 RepID=A0AAV4I9H9_9GAST|nr:synaptotagmin-like protein 5 [Elysia marginata]
MPAANFQRGRVGGKELGRENGKSGGDTNARVSPIKLDLRDLSDREEIMIMEVIKRDERERAILDAKISEVRREIQELRKAGALVSGDDPAHMCARCKAKIAVGGAAKILPWVGGERAERCIVCKFLVCPKCRSRQANGSWTCVLCLKYRQEKLLTGEVFNKSQKPEPMGSDLLRQSLRDRSASPCHHHHHILSRQCVIQAWAASVRSLRSWRV